MEITAEITEPGEISFWTRVSSEPNYDYMSFSIDGTQQEQWAGELPWSHFSAEIETGEHTFRWRYEKDSNYSHGADAAWLDYIVFPLTVDLQGVSLSHGNLPASLTLTPYPNPFNSVVTLNYNTGDLSAGERIEISVFNLLGREVRTLVDSPQTAGAYRISWNGRDNYGVEMSSGLYFCRLQVGDRSVVKKITLLK
jgi:hypothetical protein